jgi:ABC-type uncharacterized transport system permease subunit
MNSSVFGISASIAYILATMALIRSIQTDFNETLSGWIPTRWLVLSLGWVGAWSHAASLMVTQEGVGNFNFTFLSSASLAALSIVFILLLATLAKPVDKLGIIIFPLATILLLLKMVFPEGSHLLKQHSWQMNLHILFSLMSYSFLNIAALQALFVAFQDWHLRTHHANVFMRSLPPLETMENLLFQLIATGFVLLSFSLLTGALFIENLFAQHLAHKTILSILAWILFGILLVQRRLQGWRGKTAIRWTLGAFGTLMLAYFGSKMVLEWILKRG